MDEFRGEFMDAKVLIERFGRKGLVGEKTVRKSSNCPRAWITQVKLNNSPGCAVLHRLANRT